MHNSNISCGITISNSEWPHHFLWGNFCPLWIVSFFLILISNPSILSKSLFHFVHLAHLIHLIVVHWTELCLCLLYLFMCCPKCKKPWASEWWWASYMESESDYSSYSRSTYIPVKSFPTIEVLLFQVQWKVLWHNHMVTNVCNWVTNDTLWVNLRGHDIKVSVPNDMLWVNYGVLVQCIE
jgi:hypothetical protein